MWNWFFFCIMRWRSIIRTAILYLKLDVAVAVGLDVGMRIVYWSRRITNLRYPLFHLIKWCLFICIARWRSTIWILIVQLTFFLYLALTLNYSNCDCVPKIGCNRSRFSCCRNANRLLITPDHDSSLSTFFMLSNGVFSFVLCVDAQPSELWSCHWFFFCRTLCWRSIVRTSIVYLKFDVTFAVDLDVGTRIVYWSCRIMILRYPLFTSYQMVFFHV